MPEFFKVDIFASLVVIVLLISAGKCAGPTRKTTSIQLQPPRKRRRQTCYPIRSAKVEPRRQLE